MSSDDTTDNLNENENQYIKTVESQWNIPELKKETSRLILRAHKKIDKASKRLSNAQSILEDIRTKPNPTLEELESCPNMTLLEQELTDIQTRLQSLNTLEQMLVSHVSKSKSSTVLPLEIASLAIELQVNDMPPPRNNNPNRTPKVKGPREKDVPPRKPYFSYYTKNNTEIRVGRRAIDNDELSCNPLHRDSQDWWMHASGCPGSHIVIRCHDNSLDDDVIMDAASLAARQSKCTGAIINVSLTRCRDVKKPPGAKAGLVQLTGKVTTVSVNMKKVEDRLVRLDATCSNSQ
jgi:predicted ribosome quality control (RQC) complex YloA/Tae2 family protein